MTASLIELGKRPRTEESQEIPHLKPPVDGATLIHKQLTERPDYRRIPPTPK